MRVQVPSCWCHGHKVQIGWTVLRQCFWPYLCPAPPRLDTVNRTENSKVYSCPGSMLEALSIFPLAEVCLIRDLNNYKCCSFTCLSDTNMVTYAIGVIRGVLSNYSLWNLLNAVRSKSNGFGPSPHWSNLIKVAGGVVSSWGNCQNLLCEVNLLGGNFMWYFHMTQSIFSKMFE